MISILNTASHLSHRYVFPPEILRRISSRITNEATAGINHITCDISSKPPFFFTA
ncbi:hypothetical protein B0H14DRAFT_2400526 [Mycena olivaceomarginata]|nr:hypothetical protein B0H14DRAFT_2400526 [Mycena olivaceomarginata]